MGVLDQVTDMQRRGVSEQQIINKLQEQGVSPKEVKDAMGRAQIKSAVSSEGSQNKGMQRSMMGSQSQAPNQKQNEQGKKGYYEDDLDVPSPGQRAKLDNFSRQTMEMGQENTQNQQQEQEQGTYTPSTTPQFSQQPQQGYGGYSEGSYGGYQDYSQGYEGYGDYGQEAYGYTDTDTMIEISEQVFSEKIKPHLKKIEESSEFKSLAETKIENLSKRLERLEFQIDKLQAAILEKVGAYGRGLENVKKEMKMVEESFSKMAKGLSGTTKGTTTRKSSKRKGSGKTKTIHKSKKTSTRKSGKTKRKKKKS